MKKDDNGLNHTLGWSGGILPFYENVLRGHEMEKGVSDILLREIMRDGVIIYEEN